MNFNINNWKFTNWAAYFVAICMVPNFILAVPVGYIFACTAGEYIGKINR